MAAGKKLKKDEIVKVIDLLKKEYPDAGCALEHRNVFELLVATVLSAQTTDKSVNQVTPGLFSEFPDPGALSKATREDVEKHIKRIGMYHQKAKNIIALSGKLVSEYDSEVPGQRSALEALPGVGRKTANVVLAEGFGEQHIAVDTHVFRVSNRIGLCREKDALTTEKALLKVLPEDRLTESHHSLIFHGRYCCHARNPECGRCCIRDICKKNI